MEFAPWRSRTARLAAVIAVAIGMAACSQTPKPEDALGGYGKGGPATPGSTRDFAQNVGDIVYFSTDQTDLSPEAQQTLSSQARWLQKYSQYSMTIEGHADERGTREYNIALGARRAQNVRDFLARNGVSASRIRTISYGKERPAVLGSNEAAWSQNRRSVSVVN